MDTERKIIKEYFGSVGFLYDRERREILLHLRDGKTTINPNQWAFFGGDKEGSETPIRCFIRELKEETGGIGLQEEEVKSLCDYFNKELNVYRYVFYVNKRAPKEEITLTEGKDCKWIPLDKVFEYDLTEKTRRDLNTFLQLEKMENKNHHGFETWRYAN